MNVTESDDLFVVLNTDKSEVLKRKPVAYLVCNQSPPGADGTPSLMTFRDVETLFHEVKRSCCGNCLKRSDCCLTRTVRFITLELILQSLNLCFVDNVASRY